MLWVRHMNKHLKGSILIITAMLLYSITGPFVRLVSIEPEKILFFTYLFGIIFLLIYFVFTKQLKKLVVKKERFLLFFIGLLSVLTTFAYYKAYILTTLSNAVLVHYLAPVIAAVSAIVFLKEKLERITVVSLVLSLFGLYLITSPNLVLGNKHLLGIFFAFSSAVGYGLWIVTSKKLVKKLSFEVILFYQGIVSILILLPLIGFDLSLTLKPFSLLAVYALLIYVLSGFLFLAGIKYVEAQHVGIIAYAEVIFVVLFGFLFFKEIPGISTLIGGLLIIFSGYLVVRSEAVIADKEY